jgi:hypothetical protein
VALQFFKARTADTDPKMSRRESERPGHTHAATNNKVLIWLRLLGLRPAARFAALAEIADAARSVNERPMLVVIAASHLMSALAQIVISRRAGVSMRSPMQLPARFNESSRQVCVRAQTLKLYSAARQPLLFSSWYYGVVQLVDLCAIIW